MMTTLPVLRYPIRTGVFCSDFINLYIKFIKLCVHAVMLISLASRFGSYLVLRDIQVVIFVLHFPVSILGSLFINLFLSAAKHRCYMLSHGLQRILLSALLCVMLALASRALWPNDNVLSLSPQSSHLRTL